MYNISFYFILFLIYSIIGWTLEVITSYVRHKKFINRGFMLGPYCPIYGYSSIIMIFYLNNYKDNILTVFLLAIVICSIVEYIISYIMEKMFSARWWDYSNRKFNVNGRICLTNAFFFGLLGLLLVYIVNPLFEDLLSSINNNTLTITGIILIIIFISDLTTSLIITFNLKNKIKNLNTDVTEELNEKIKTILETKILNRRILKAYPRYRANIIKKYSKTKHEIFKDKIEKVKEKIKK